MKLIKAGDSTYAVRFDINTLIDFEELTNIDLTQGGDGTDMGLKEIRTLFHLGLCNGSNDYPNEDHKKSGRILTSYCEENGGFEALTDLMREELGKVLGKQKSHAHLQEITK